jgi:acyl-CoA hydrolase
MNTTLNTVYETSFVVYPRHVNCRSPLIFGGAFFSEMDICAATVVKRFLYASKTAKSAVTHKFEGTFLKPCYMGNLIFLNAKITSVGPKSIVVEVEAYRDTEAGQELVAEANFVFVTVENDNTVEDKPDKLPYCQHGLTL